MSVDVEVASPLCWIGGKQASAKRILAAFPPASAYGTYVEVFGGGGPCAGPQAACTSSGGVQ